jgi:hypothetical protein
MIWIRSSEPSKLAAVIASVAAFTKEVIWKLVRELESILLVLRVVPLECLELLVEERLTLSSPITVEEREGVVVSSSENSSLKPSSQEMTKMLKVMNR